MFTRRSATTTSYAAVSAAVVLLAVTAHGQTVRKAELNDGGVWVTSGSDHAFGRYIKSIGQLDAQIYPQAAQATDLDVLQDGASVLAWDRTSSKLYGVDVSARQLQGEGAVVPAAYQVGLAGGTLAALDDKGVLRASRTQAGAPDPTTVSSSGPSLLDHLDGPASLAVGADGSVTVATRDRVTVLHPQGPGFARPIVASLPPTAAAYQVTLVGGSAVVAATAGGAVLAVDGTRTRVLQTGLGAGVRLQQPGPAADTVAVAAQTGLALVPLDGGAPTQVSDAGRAAAAAPVRVGRCVFSAWADGAYAKSCAGTLARRVDGFTPTGSAPVFRVNRGLVLLNDVATGAVFEADDTLRAALQVWSRVRHDDNASEKTVEHDPLKHQGDDKPPQPRDDVFGARPGRATVLDVLDNDTDPEGDLLVVSRVDAAGAPGALAVPAPDGQSIIFTMPEGATGEFHLRYTADDGHGASAQASVTVQPRSSGQNEPPALRKGYQAPALAVAPGGTLRLPVLPDWRDFDGDPLLVRNTAPAGSVVATTDGSLLVTAPLTPGPFVVGYAVTDGLSEPVAAPPLTIQVLDPASAAPFAPPVARPDSVRITVGQPATLTPLANDLPGADGTDPQAHLVLAGPVAPQEGLTTRTDAPRGLVTVQASRPGTFNLVYGAAFGHAPVATGEIRVDAVLASDSDGAPVAVPDTAVLRGQRPVVVDVLDNDYDPAGGLLVVQDATGDDRAGVSATVLDGRSLRIVANGSAAVPSGRVTYRVSNGRGAPVTGSVAVTLLGATTDNALPFALDDTVTVRAGDSAAVPVLDNDIDPDGDTLALLPVAVTIDPAIPGVAASVSGRTVRVAAPATVTEQRQVTLSYIAVDPSGARGQGRVSVDIVPAGPVERDQPPTPRDLEGRLVAGDTYLVKVPVYGVDPDGDSVTVTSVVQPPSLGRVTAVGPDSISYQSYPDSGGTDSLTYEVVDAQGRTGQATVRLAVVPPGALSAPVAVDDAIAAVPGRTVHLDVTGNDLVAPGARLEVLPLDRFGAVPAGVRLDGKVISLPVPAEKAPPLVVPYAISDGSGPPSVANVVVRGDSTALLPPVAQDDAPPSDVRLDAPITVDVLRNDDDPDGSSADLKVTTFAGDVQVDGGRITVKASAEPHQVAYIVTDSDGLTAMAAVRVPGQASPLPKVKPGARVRVDVGQSVTVSLADVVEDPAGKPVRLTTTDRVFASPAAGLQAAAATNGSLTVTATGSYAGPGAVSFQVTDGESLQDGRLVELTVPVQVGPDAPALRCPASPLQPVQGGADVVVDLLSLCHVWIDTTVKTEPVRLKASVVQPLTGVTAEVKESTRLVLTAASAAQAGATGAIALTVPGTPVTASLPVAVVAAPAAKVRAVTLDGLQADVARIVDLAQYVTSPLREPQIGVVGVRQLSGGPAPVTFQGTGVTVTPGHDTKGAVVLEVTLTDQPGRPDRQVTASLSGQVQGRPGVPGRPGATSVGNQEVVLSWATPPDNGAPIQRYEISGADRVTTCPASPCTVGGLRNGQAYTFSVVAVNVVGTSDPSQPSAATTPDRVPDAVSTVRLVAGDGTLNATWDAPSGDYTAVKAYQVEIQPAPPAGALRTVGSAATDFSGLKNGTTYQVRVRAQNTAVANGGFGDWSASASEVPFGAPLVMTGLRAAGAAVAGASSERAITVTWSAADNNGRQVTKYYVTRYVSATASGSGSAESTTAVDAGQNSLPYSAPNRGDWYSFTIVAENQAGRSPESGHTQPVQAAAPPNTMTAPVATDHPSGSMAGYNRQIHVRITLPEAHAGSLERVEYRLNGRESSSYRWPTPGGQPGTVLDEVAPDLVNGIPVQVAVRGCNDAQLCGAWSSASGFVTPYTFPDAPQVQGTGSSTSNAVHYSWGGAGNNGLLIEHYQVCLTGWDPCHNVGPGSVDMTYDYSTSWSIFVTAVDMAGQSVSSPNPAARGQTPARPAPPQASISASQGDAVSVTGCTVSCHWLDFQVHNFPPGQYGWECYTNGALSFSSGSYTVNVTSSEQTFKGNRYCAWGAGTEAIRFMSVTSNPVQHF